MAVFLINVCKFNGCGITFPSLSDLIQHIEDTHIDYDPQVIELKEQQKPQCIPLSYALRFITDTRKEDKFLSSVVSVAAGVDLKRKLAIKHHSYSLSSSNRSSTPTIGSDMDDDEMELSESDDSNDSWTTEEFSSEFIMKYGSRHSGTSNNSNGNNEKPFACPVPGCKKRYKNVNGIKYHSKNGHKKDGKIRKCFKCHCGKSYKTSQGLKSHANIAHSQAADASSISSITSSMIHSPLNASISGGDLSSSSSSNCSNISNNNNNNNSSNNSSLIVTSINTSPIIATTANTIPPTIATSITKNSNHLISNNINNNNNYSLITIKTKPATLIKSQSGKKLFKVIQDEGGVINNSGSTLNNSCSNESGLSKLDSSASSLNSNSSFANVKITLPSLLGILTPATSPSQSQPQQQITQSVVSQNSINNNDITTTTTTTSTNLNGCPIINLPLTPISPNMSKNLNFLTSNEITILTEQQT